MIFTDPFFLFVFLPVAALVFHLVGRRYGTNGGLATIFLFSLLFYAPWGAWMTAILIVSVSLNFLCGAALIALGEDRKSLRKALLAAGEVANFSALIWFKYHLFAGLVQDAGARDVADWVVPAGISFYTFHQAAFLADAYAREVNVMLLLGKLKTARDIATGFIRYGAFVVFFPQLVIGPITYVKEFLPQVTSARFGRIFYINLSIGFTLIAIGMFKKLVLADNLGIYSDSVFERASMRIALSPLESWLGIASYYLQLYFDFSGYSDMALGLARMFGLRYPINFFSPFKAVGIIDYYRRWHMTLTRVISRFLFTPLSLAGTRLAARKRYSAMAAKILGLWLPLLINFEVIGLWHGAIWSFVVFGLIHGIWYVAETEVRSSKRWKKWRKTVPDVRRAIYGRIILLVLMPLCFALFRADSLETALFLGGQLLSGPFVPAIDAEMQAALKPLIAGFAIVYLLPNSVELLRGYRPGILTYQNPSYGPQWRLRWRPNWPWALFFGAIFVVCIYYMYRQPPFLYQGF